MMMMDIVPGGGAVNPQRIPEPFRQSLDLLGWLLFVYNFRLRFRTHVGQPCWLVSRPCIFSCVLASVFLFSGALSVLGSLFEMGFSSGDLSS